MIQLAISRRYLRLIVLLSVVAILIILGLTGALATVKPIKEAQTVASIYGGGVAFDPAKYVEGIWSSKVLPAARDSAVPLHTIVAALEKSPQNAVDTYGNDVGGSFNFLVHFEGTVTKVDTSSPIGTITVDVPLDGKSIPVHVAIGPVILGNAVRDSLKFISFGQFLNQVQYGGAGDALNTYVAKHVVATLDPKTISGKKVQIRGAFTYDGSSPEDIQVTPIIMSVE